ncbi:MAG: hypothetical protein Q8930_04600 [Bacillota bacterium]|nr:hypothetical protein [Bacillota bacterium]
MAKPRRVIDVDVYEEEEKEPQRRHRVPESNSGRGPKRKIERKIDRDEDEERRAASNSNPGNFDLGQLTGLLQNVDMNQIASMLGGLGGNSGGGQGLLGNIAQMMGGSGGQNLFGNLAGMMGGAPEPDNAPPAAPMYNGPFRGDRRLQVLSALKPMVSPERAALIDMIMQIYVISKVLRG